MTRTSLLDELLALVDEYHDADWFRRNAHALSRGLRDLFGQGAAQHHDGLVRRFIEEPAVKLNEQGVVGLTASGPPLPVLLRSLEVLRDLRLAADRPDLSTRHEDLRKLRSAVSG